MISSSVIGRPSISPPRMASTTSPRGAERRRCATKSTIQSYIPFQAWARSGFVGIDAAIDMALISATSSDGAWSTISKNASPGKGRANSLMNSHSPRSAKPSTRRVTRRRVPSSYCATAAGVKYEAINRLYSRWSGGSTCSGMALTGVCVPGTETPCAELKVFQSWATRRTSWYELTIQYPPCASDRVTGHRVRMMPSVSLRCCATSGAR